ncbi:MAG: permease, partial [Rhodoferax sp.]|nr:permease [Rhodoferax sp.]
MSTTPVHPVDERLPSGKLAALGLQHVLVMYAGAVAVPLIVGRALKLSPEQVSMLISADLFCCGLVTLIQSLGATQWFGIRLPVMMGVTFASVAPMLAIANGNPGVAGAQMIFGSVIGAGVVSILIAPLVSRMLRFFPPVVTGTIIAVIGISLMRIGINWIFGNPFGPTAPNVVSPEQAKWLADAAAALPATPMPKGLALVGSVPNPQYAPVDGIVVSALVLASILLIAKYTRGFISNISVLLGIVIGGIAATAMGMMTFEKVAQAHWFDIVMPLQFGMPIFDPVLILTMSLVMVVVMIESTGMFLALGEMTEREITQPDLARGLRTDGLGTVLGGLFNTFPYTSFSQNVGLVGVTGVRSRFVCVAGGLIMIVLGLLPKMAALIESLPTVVLGGAGLVMFGMV